jgi:TRAP-type C4-dicarboxylate transport system permease small subunit
MLLNAYGWWKVSQITYIAALISFGLAGLALIGSLIALATGRKPETPAVAEVLPGTGAQAQAKAA